MLRLPKTPEQKKDPRNLAMAQAPKKLNVQALKKGFAAVSQAAQENPTPPPVVIVKPKPNMLAYVGGGAAAVGAVGAAIAGPLGLALGGILGGAAGAIGAMVKGRDRAVASVEQKVAKKLGGY